MARQIMTLVAIGMFSFSCFADDVCDIRPDLCDNSTSTVNFSNQKVRPRRIPSSAQHQQARPLQAQHVQAARCRVPGAPYNLDDANLPICQNRRPTSQSVDAPGRYNVPAESESSASAREPSSVPQTIGESVTFDDYMKANAMNPAMDLKISDHQKAFVDTSKPAILHYTVDDSGSSREIETQASAAAAAAPGLPAPGATGVPQQSAADAAAAAGYSVPAGLIPAGMTVPANLTTPAGMAAAAAAAGVAVPPR